LLECLMRSNRETNYIKDKLICFFFLLQMADFLEANYLAEQVESIKEIGNLITKLKHAGPGLGEFLIDRELSK